MLPLLNFCVVYLFSMYKINDNIIFVTLFPISGLSLRVRGRRFSLATFIGNKTKIGLKELNPSWKIPLLLIEYTQQLEMLATALNSCTLFVLLFFICV